MHQEIFKMPLNFKMFALDNLDLPEILITLWYLLNYWFVTKRLNFDLNLSLYNIDRCHVSVLLLGYIYKWVITQFSVCITLGLFTEQCSGHIYKLYYQCTELKCDIGRFTKVYLKCKLKKIMF